MPEASDEEYAVVCASVELSRHTDYDGDSLTPEGMTAAALTGRKRLSPPYAIFASTAATQLIEILRRTAGQENVPVTELTGLHSSVEDLCAPPRRLPSRASSLATRTS